MADDVSTSHALVYTLPTRWRQDLSCQLSASAVCFQEKSQEENIKHGEQQRQSHFYVSTYINAIDFFFSSSYSELGCQGAWASGKLSVVWKQSVVANLREVKEKGGFDAGDV